MGFLIIPKVPSPESGCGQGPGPLHLEALGKGPSCLLLGSQLPPSTPSPLGVPMSPLLVRSLDLGCLIRGELGRWLLEKLLGVCELGEQGPWKARPAVRTGLQWSLSA